jgi:hypothetical protein
MRLISLILSFAACAFTPLAASAEVSEKFVNVETLNCRMEPATNAGVVQKLTFGTRVVVLREEHGWSILDAPYCWVSSEYLSSDAPAAPVAFTQSDPVRTRLSTPSTTRTFAYTPKVKKVAKPKRKSVFSKRRTPQFSSGSCPCSGSNVCIGPRGGRYCITSGGNKRYGV